MRWTVYDGEAMRTLILSLSNLFQNCFLNTDFPNATRRLCTRTRRDSTAEVFPFQRFVVDSGHQKGPRSRDRLTPIPQVMHICLCLPVKKGHYQKRALVRARRESRQAGTNLDKTCQKG